MAGEQVFIGMTTTGICAIGLVRQGWFLNETEKGRRLVRMCGARNALWVFRVLLVAGVLFGLALAAGIVNPVRWSGTTENPSSGLAGRLAHRLPTSPEIRVA